MRCCPVLLEPPLFPADSVPSSQGRPEKPQSCSDVTLRIDPMQFSFSSSKKKGPIKGWLFRIAAHMDTFFEWCCLHITLSDSGGSSVQRCGCRRGPGRPYDPAFEGSPTVAHPTATRSPSGASSLELRRHACEITVDCQCGIHVLPLYCLSIFIIVTIVRLIHLILFRKTWVTFYMGHPVFCKMSFARRFLPLNILFDFILHIS